MLNRRADATERLLEIAAALPATRQARRRRPTCLARLPVEERLTHALVHGITDFIDGGRGGGAAAADAAAATSSKAR